MQTQVYVTIHNLKALYNSTDMVVDVDANNFLVLQPYDSTGNTPTQVWQLIPNVVLGGYGGGYTLYNPQTGQSACDPGKQGGQVYLNDDPTPWGASSYCWTMFSVGTTPNEEKLTIQDFQRNLCMNASGGSIEAGTQIIMWTWSGNHDNETWILRAANPPTSAAKS